MVTIRGGKLICARCPEEIEDGQLAECQSTPLHRECFFRLVIGSVCHVRRECSCYGGAHDGDPEGVTPREAAMLATLEWYRRNAPEMSEADVYRMYRGTERGEG